MGKRESDIYNRRIILKIGLLFVNRVAKGRTKLPGGIKKSGRTSTNGNTGRSSNVANWK